MFKYLVDCICETQFKLRSCCTFLITKMLDMLFLLLCLMLTNHDLSYGQNDLDNKKSEFFFCVALYV